MNFRRLFRSAALVLFFTGAAQAQTNLSGGTGLPNVESAWSLDPGLLMMSSNTRVFGQSSAAYTVWDVSGRLNFSYGLGRHFEVSATPIIYQDANQPSNKVSAPHDLYISMKAASFTSPGSPFSYGASVALKFPTGDAQNVAFERYSANRIGWGVTGLLSYATDPLYPRNATNFHLNLGYWNHNDSGADLTGAGALSPQPDGASQELLYAMGVQIPKGKFAITTELYGNAFLKAPPVVAYSRENYLYLTPGVSYQLMKWMSVNVGMDLRIISSKDKTFCSSGYDGADRTLAGSQPNYPGWRFNFGASFDLLPGKSYRVGQHDVLMRKAESRRQLFEQIVREQRDTESAEAELQRIRAERIRAEQELERLRGILEGETQKASDDSQEQSPPEEDN